MMYQPAGAVFRTSPRRVAVVSLLVIVLASLFVAALPQPRADAESPATEGVWIATSGGQSWSEGLINTVADMEPAELAAAEETLLIITSSADPYPEKGVQPWDRRALDSLHDILTTGQLDRLDALEETVVAERQARQAAEEQRIAAQLSHTATADVGVLSWSWPLRGSAINNRRSWQQTQILEGQFCAPICTLTDRITARLTVDPHPTLSRVQLSVLYSPNGGNYNSANINMLPLCRDGGTSSTCGNTNPATVTSGADTKYVSSTNARWGKYLAHGLAYSAFFRPLGADRRDYAKTGTSLCRLQPDAWCTY